MWMLGLIGVFAVCKAKSNSGLCTSVSKRFYVSLCRWLTHVRETIRKDELDANEAISWAAYHARLQPEPEFMPSISALLPLFTEESKSVAMMRHSLDIVKKAVEHLNHGQKPVVAFDQPLFTLAKQIQWCWPERYGEGHFVIMLGGLHTEMAVLRCLGHWLDGSGWTNALTQAQIASSGVADSFLKASHVTRTRHAHQVTACCLHILLHKAYMRYHGGVPKPDTLGYEDWVVKMANDCPQFQYWFLTLQLELLVLVFVKSLREGHFHLYVESLCKLVPWLFALDQTNYARWLPVHIRDMTSLHETHPDLYVQFVNGNFVIRKTQRRFSAISIDQAHEQNNALVKDEGGAIGLTENPAAFLRWMVAGPEIVRVITEFENHERRSQVQSEKQHHEQTKEMQTSFKKDVSALVDVMDDMGNPFLEESGDLLVLDSKNLADVAVIQTVRTVEKLGQDQYESFINQRIKSRDKSIFHPISRNQLPLFSNQKPREVTKSKLQLEAVKNECSLFSKLYIASQVRDSNLDHFFQHENGPCPPALSDRKTLYQGTKSDLIECLLNACPQPEVVDPPVTQALVIDGAAVVNMLKPRAAKTFLEYGDQVFYPFIESKLRNVSRVDIVFDQYLPESLKETTRQKRGRGVRRRVSGEIKIPNNWQAFLRIDENKTELFHFLAEFVVRQPTTEGKRIYVTDGQDVLTNPSHLDTTSLAPCNQEEADSRIFLHVADAVN